MAQAHDITTANTGGINVFGRATRRSLEARPGALHGAALTLADLLGAAAVAVPLLVGAHWLASPGDAAAARTVGMAALIGFVIVQLRLSGRYAGPPHHYGRAAAAPWPPALVRAVAAAGLLHVAALIATSAGSPADVLPLLVWPLLIPALLLARRTALAGPAMAAPVVAMDSLHPAHASGAGNGRQRSRVNHPVGRAAKMTLDRVGAFTICLVAAPVIVALAVVVTRDGGPLLFRHRRVGHQGQTFMCLKFRTMVVDADERLAELLAHDPAARTEWDATQKLVNDPRVTRYGRLLRNTSLDELPQLLNVLRGEMSLVGPRPIVPAEIPRYGDDISLYFEAFPGLTGLWQVSGRSDTSYQRRVELDCEYVRTWSFWGDLQILLKTVPAVLLKRGAV